MKPIPIHEDAPQGADTCLACGRPLTAEGSCERHVGPKCAKKIEAEKSAGGRSLMDNELVTLTQPHYFDVVISRTKGRLETNVPRSVVKHSPDGFEAGYVGSGPADLALNILNAFVPPGSDDYRPVRCQQGEASRTAHELYQFFKHEFIATMPREGGRINAIVIYEWLAENARKHGLLPDESRRSI